MAAKKGLSTENAELIKKNADYNLFLIFGRCDDKEIINLIPVADRFEKHNSVCEKCKSDASFMINNEILCRECKNATEIQGKTAKKVTWKN